MKAPKRFLPTLIGRRNAAQRQAEASARWERHSRALIDEVRERLTRPDSQLSDFESVGRRKSEFRSDFQFFVVKAESGGSVQFTVDLNEDHRTLGDRFEVSVSSLAEHQEYRAELDASDPLIPVLHRINAELNARPVKIRPVYEPGDEYVLPGEWERSEDFLNSATAARRSGPTSHLERFPELRGMSLDRRPELSAKSAGDDRLSGVSDGIDGLN